MGPFCYMCFVFVCHSEVSVADNSKSIGCKELKSSHDLLSCQPRVIVTSCFVCKVTRDLESIYHLCIYPIRRIGLILK